MAQPGMGYLIPAVSDVIIKDNADRSKHLSYLEVNIWTRSPEADEILAAQERHRRSRRLHLRTLVESAFSTGYPVLLRLEYSDEDAKGRS